MAETTLRSKLIQQQIENLLQNAPPAVTQAERDQITRGRKGQKDIDAGREAIARRADEVKQHNDKIEALNRQLGEALSQEGAAEKVRKREESSDPLTQNFLPFAAGAVAGGAYGELANRGLHAFEKGNVDALKEIGDELGPTKDLTSSQMNRSRAVGAMKAAERFAPTNPLMKGANLIGRGAAYGIPAAAILYEQNRYQKLASDPNAADAERNTNQAIANGLLGGATGIAVEGGRRFVFPSRDPGMGQALSRIEAARDYATRMDVNDARASNPLLRSAEARTPPTIDITPQPIPPSPKPALTSSAPAPTEAAQAQAERLRHSERLSRAVAAAGGKAGRGKAANYQALAKGVTSDNVEAVAKALDLPSGTPKSAILQRARELMNTKGVSSMAGPGIAAALAYAATPDRAQAADGRSSGINAAALTNSGIAGGAAYGVQKGLEALPGATGKALGMAGEATAPSMIDTMTDYSPDEMAQGRNFLARNLPSGLRGGAVEDAYQMAQVPEASPYRQQPMEAAQSLEIPQGIPAPNEDGSSPYGDPGGSDGDFETSMAELQAMLAEIGASQEESPVPNAVRSQSAAMAPGFQMPQNRLMAQY